MKTQHPEQPAAGLRPGQRRARLASALGAMALMAGCASVPHPTPGDPWESFNRGVYTVNDTADRYFLKPIAKGYATVTPRPVRSCIHNIFGNLGDVWSGVNSFLQGRGHDFVNTLGRVLFNTTMGLGGCFDVASMNGARKIPNDFGITLGVWGLDSGPYLVLPFYGASSLRDAAGTAVALTVPSSPTAAILSLDDVPVRNSLVGLYIVDTRAHLLDAEELVDQVALDKYSFIRDAYLQRRHNMVQTRRHDRQAPGDDEAGRVDPSLPVYTDPDDELPVYTDPEDE